MHENQWNPSITALHDCAVSCEVCAQDCMREKNIHSLVNCIRASLDCANVCRVTAAFLARTSDSTKTLCRACAEVCAHCARICEVHDLNYCQACARACRRAQEECEAILA